MFLMNTTTKALLPGSRRLTGALQSLDVPGGGEIVTPNQDEGEAQRDCEDEHDGVEDANGDDDS